MEGRGRRRKEKGNREMCVAKIIYHYCLTLPATSTSPVTSLTHPKRVLISSQPFFSLTDHSRCRQLWPAVIVLHVSHKMQHHFLMHLMHVIFAKFG